MPYGLLYGSPFLEEGFCLRREVGLNEPLPDVVDSLGRGVQHVRGVEAVVAQLVAEELVDREICHWMGSLASRTILASRTSLTSVAAIY